MTPLLDECTEVVDLSSNPIEDLISIPLVDLIRTSLIESDHV
jgi:hypothetical protein